MPRPLALAAALLVGWGTAASAADVPGRAGEGSGYVPLFLWTGYYAGLNAGYGSSDNRQRTFCAPPAGGTCAILPNLNTDGDGFVVGGQVGYNQQIGRFLVGGEADLQYADIGRTRTAAGLFPDGLGGLAAVTSYGATQRLNYLGTARARLGMAFNRVFVFGTGGLAYGDVSVRQTVSFAAGSNYAAAGGGTEVGWAAGAGVEYGFAPNITGKVEALYYDLGRTSVSSGAAAAPGFTRGARFDTDGVVARAGLNYKFDLF